MFPDFNYRHSLKPAFVIKNFLYLISSSIPFSSACKICINYSKDSAETKRSLFPKPNLHPSALTSKLVNKKCLSLHSPAAHISSFLFSNANAGNDQGRLHLFQTLKEIHSSPPTFMIDAAAAASSSSSHESCRSK
ncbi:hypothetical protein XENOCAPTIV_007006 [Xenoophorus captivus]|uniref:Uncharacterized protein n=1 Tax=Xenoophorus captivus TaxID=1517983 RepID=A0ABV0S0P7_9TELE